MRKTAILLLGLMISLPVFAVDRDAVYFYDSGCKKGQARDFDGAIADFTKAVKLNPKYKEAFDLMGSMYAYKNDMTSAIQNWDKAIAIDPKFATAYMNRAMGKKAIGDTDGEIDDLTEANQLGINEALVMRSDILREPKMDATGGFVFHNNRGYYCLPKGGLEIQGTVVSVIDGFNIVVNDILNNNYHICLDKMIYPGAGSAEFKRAKAFTKKYCLGKKVIARAAPQEKKDCLRAVVVVADVKIFLNDALISAGLAKKTGK